MGMYQATHGHFLWSFHLGASEKWGDGDESPTCFLLPKMEVPSTLLVGGFNPSKKY